MLFSLDILVILPLTNILEFGDLGRGLQDSEVALTNDVPGSFLSPLYLQFFVYSFIHESSNPRQVQRSRDDAAGGNGLPPHLVPKGAACYRKRRSRGCNGGSGYVTCCVFLFSLSLGDDWFLQISTQATTLAVAAALGPEPSVE